MNPEKLTIGEMAKLNHVSIQTLRLYDKKGLLKPIEVDEFTNYRYYHINQSSRLDMIGHLQRCGLSLDEIKEQLESHNINKIRKTLDSKLLEIDEEIEKLRRNKAAIKRSIKNYDRYEKFGNDIIFKEHIQERYIYKHVSKYNFFGNEELGYEFMLREFKKNMVNESIPLSYFYNVGTIMRKENLKKKKFLANEVFVFLDESYMDIPGVEIIEEGFYISVCSNDFKMELDKAKELLEEIEKNNYKVVGDYICEVIAEFPVLDDESRDIFYKIQIPISFK